MAFTYDLSTNVGKIRLELGDTIQNSGIRPNNGNLSDEELQYWYDRELNVMRAVAAACEALARMWSTAASISIGPHSESLSDVAEAWDKRAKLLRQQYGDTPGSTSGQFTPIPFYRDQYTATE